MTRLVLLGLVGLVGPASAYCGEVIIIPLQVHDYYYYYYYYDDDDQ